MVSRVTGEGVAESWSFQHYTVVSHPLDKSGIYGEIERKFFYTLQMIIYKATNIINNKSYIGQTTRSLEKRMEAHIYSSKSGKTPFMKSMRKYGPENYKWTILCRCSSKEMLNTMEYFYITHYKTHIDDGGYNLTWGGEGTVGHKHTDESKEKMCLAKVGKNTNTPESRRINSEKHLGIVRSEETRKKMSDAQIGKKHSQETKDKISKAIKNKPPDTDETRKKRSSSIKEWWSKRKNDGWEKAQTHRASCNKW